MYIHVEIQIEPWNAAIFVRQLINFVHIFFALTLTETLLR